jgi:hypothetical protein
MRNLKRALSLALASVMMLGMMVVGSSAKGLDDFTDADEVVNEDAVAVTSAIGIFDGYTDGSFKPTNVVTRAEMAVIISKMLYGADVNVDQFKDTKVFTDVPDWAEGYVNLCSSLGIIAGRGNGIFDPNATVTTAEAATMLTKALGYFQNENEYGDNWKLAATAKATQLGLYGDLKLSADAGLTRDNVAELTFNALTKAVPVQYNSLLGVYYNENKGITYALTFYYTDTLGYKNFDLVYRTNDTTDYGRPGTTWGTGSYRNTSSTTSVGNDSYGLNEDGSLKPSAVKMTEENEIITVADTPYVVYTANTKQSVVYNALGKTIVDTYSWDAYVDGHEQTSLNTLANDKDNDYGYTNKGATTEIYVDDVNEQVTVVQIDYYTAQVTKVSGGVTTVKMLSNNMETRTIDDRTIENDEFSVDAYVVVTVDEDDDGDSFIATIAAPETVEGTVTKVKKDSDPENGVKGNYVVMDDGSKYTYSAYTASDLDDLNTDHPTLDIEYRLYLDPNGYVIGFEAMEKYYDNYLYVVAADSYLNSVQAKVVFSDGTSKTVDIDKKYSDGTKIDADNNGTITSSEANALVGDVFGWTEDDGTYTLRKIDAMGAGHSTGYKDGKGNETREITNGAAYLQVGTYTYIVDEDTIFVDVDEKVAYTGFENVPDYKNGTETVKFWAIDNNDNKVLDVVFIYSGEASNTSKTYFYVVNTGDFVTYSKNKTYKEWDVYIDGEATTLVLDPTAHGSVIAGDIGLYKVDRTNGSGIVTEVSKVNFSANAPVVGSRSFALGTSSAEQYTVDSDTLFVLATIDRKSNGVDQKDAVITIGSLSDMKADTDYTTTAVVVKAHSDDKIADLVYIKKVENLGVGGGGGSTSDYVVGSDASWITVSQSAKTITVTPASNYDDIGDLVAALDKGYKSGSSYVDDASLTITVSRTNSLGNSVTIPQDDWTLSTSRLANFSTLTLTVGNGTEGTDYTVIVK